MEVQYLALDGVHGHFGAQPTFRVPNEHVGDFSHMRPIAHMEEMGGEVHIPISERRNLLSPVEAATGIPLPIVVDRNGFRPNLHHGYFYKRFYARGSLGMQALRFSRLQCIAVPAHDRYHGQFRGGTAVPATTEEQYESVILNDAGYIPPYGVKMLSHGDFSINELTTKERQRLRKPGNIMIQPHDWESGATIAEFLMTHALEQDFDHVQEALIEEFLSISRHEMRNNRQLRERKYRLGMKLSNKALGRAIDPVVPTYIEARKRFQLRKDVPPTPWQVVKSAINGHEADHFGHLEARLSHLYLGAAVD